MSRDLGTVRISEQGKDQLIRLKRLTGIQGWNVLCRWALAYSLAEQTPLGIHPLGEVSNIEMSWRTFAGSYGSLIQTLVLGQAIEFAQTSESIENLLLQHVHRGLGVMRSHVDSSAGLLALLRYEAAPRHEHALGSISG